MAQRNILEVFDYRKSIAVPTLYNEEGETWRVELNSKETGELLLSHDTGIPSTPEDCWNDSAIDACYAWLRSVRDQFTKSE